MTTGGQSSTVVRDGRGDSVRQREIAIVITFVWFVRSNKLREFFGFSLLVSVWKPCPQVRAAAHDASVHARSAGGR